MEQSTEKADLFIREHADEVAGKSSRYTYHVMPPVGWMNDPNGFGAAFGKYHLFYQFHPYGAEPGDFTMCWGHYTTTDFVKWQLEPTALAPDMPYDVDGCWSGTSIVKDGRQYLMYTSVHEKKQTQSLAVSEDDVRYQKLGEVIPSRLLPPYVKPTSFRDPKVFRRGAYFYAMMGAKSVEDEGMIVLYRSRDLLTWEFVNAVRRDRLTRGGVYECPDLAEIDGTDVILASPQRYVSDDWRYKNRSVSIYISGHLDAEAGVFEQWTEDEIDGGLDFYAPQTTKTADGRIVMIAWMQMWSRSIPTAADGWAGGMILPRELTLKNGKLYQAPVREIECYRQKPVHYADVPIGDNTVLEGVSGTKIELNVIFDLGRADTVGVKLYQNGAREARITYDRTLDRVIFDRSQMGVDIAYDSEREEQVSVRCVKVDVENNRLDMRIFLDVSSCEVFLCGGQRVMTGNVYSGGSGISFFAKGEDAKLVKLDKYDIIL